MENFRIALNYFQKTETERFGAKKGNARGFYGRENKSLMRNGWQNLRKRIKEENNGEMIRLEFLINKLNIKI